MKILSCFKTSNHRLINLCVQDYTVPKTLEILHYMLKIAFLVPTRLHSRHHSGLDLVTHSVTYLTLHR